MDFENLRKYEPIFGSWYIKRSIGAGNFGAVFEIKREDFGVEYNSALKVITIPKNDAEYSSIREDTADAEEAEEYIEQCVRDIVSEFELMAKLKGHSNIVSYEDHQVIKHKDGFGWDILIRMELLTPFSAKVKQGLTRNDIINLGIDICKALELCQKYNIIHRDIKPENIFISNSGDYKLGDFGIARKIEKQSMFLSMSRKGTYPYMAPEVYKGERYGTGVDIYSLGLVLYRLLNNNRVPFMPPYPKKMTSTDRERAVILRMSGNPIPPPQNEPSGRLCEIILKACAYNPEDRYSSPMQMRKELEAIIPDKSIGFVYDNNVEIPSRGNTSGSGSFSIYTTGEDDKTEVMISIEEKNKVGRSQMKVHPAEEEVRENINRKKRLIAVAGVVCVCLGTAICLGVGYKVKKSEKADSAVQTIQPQIVTEPPQTPSAAPTVHIVDSEQLSVLKSDYDWVTAFLARVNADTGINQNYILSEKQMLQEKINVFSQMLGAVDTIEKYNEANQYYSFEVYAAAVRLNDAIDNARKLAETEAVQTVKPKTKSESKSTSAEKTPSGETNKTNIGQEQEVLTPEVVVQPPAQQPPVQEPAPVVTSPPKTDVLPPDIYVDFE